MTGNDVSYLSIEGSAGEQGPSEAAPRNPETRPATNQHEFKQTTDALTLHP
jgi:hypothetical protein